MLFALITVFHLGTALMGRSFIRATHLGTALHYAQNSIDVLHPVLVGFNATGTPTAQELPIWQAAAAMLFKLTRSTWYGWANLVSLLLFATCLWPFFQLARQYLGERCAWWATVFFLAQPLIVVMAGEAAADGLCLVASIWFLFFADKLVRTASVLWWLPTALFGALSAVLKLPFFVAAGLCSVCMLVVHRNRDLKSWGLLASTGAAAAVVMAVWSRHADSLAASAEYPYYELRLSQSQDLVMWFFGDLQTRFSPKMWIKGGWRFLHATLGSLPFVGLLVLAFLQANNRLSKLWLLMTFITTLIFTAVVLNHWHYYLMCCPAVAFLVGPVLARWEPFFSVQVPNQLLRTSLALMVLVASSVSGLIAMKISLDLDPFTQKIARVLREHTTAQDKLVVFGEATWGGEVLFRADRRGLSVAYLDNPPGARTIRGLRELLCDGKHLQRLKSLGFTKLVLLSESPVRFAVQAANPGSQRPRVVYPESISANADAWPVVYRTEDILIKEIP